MLNGIQISNVLSGVALVRNQVVNVVTQSPLFFHAQENTIGIAVMETDKKQKLQCETDFR